jgi:hypothetical protein
MAADCQAVLIDRFARCGDLWRWQPCAPARCAAFLMASDAAVLACPRRDGGDVLDTASRKRTFLAPGGVGARSRTRPVAIRRECVAQHWTPVPLRGHCECRMVVLVSLRGFSTAQ